MALIEDVQAYLTAQEIGAPGSKRTDKTYQGNIFLANVPSRAAPTDPPTPDPVIGLFQYPGAPPEYTKMGVESESVRFQVVIASASNPVAMSKAMEVYTLLSGKNGVLMNGTRYRRIVALQTPPSAPPTLDDAGRWRVSTNYEVML